MSLPNTPSSNSSARGITSSIKVGVRVRPFNDRERSSANCVSLTPDSLSVICPDLSGSKNQDVSRTFQFDHLFPESSCQHDIYDSIGQPILEKFIEGHSCAVLAYGQTGSGKTFTMQGCKDSPGLIPNLLTDLYTSHVNQLSKSSTFEITASYLEIYMENVRDLLSNDTDYSQLLKIVDLGPPHGIQVSNLSKHPIKSMKDVQKLLSIGESRRMTGSTKMNDVSSRSHAVFCLYLKQQLKNDKEGFSTRFSKLFLVDLAGSERVGDAGTSGIGLKEGTNINKSLSALASVVTSIVKNQPHVPYRDSKLTRLLQDAFSFGVTSMLCNISPSSMCFDETLSTLRFADRAQKIKLHSVVRRDPAAQKIAELKEEIEELKGYVTRIESSFCLPFRKPVDRPSGLAERQRSCVIL
ncbi:hypothetical protein GEMRC1_003329 [Eukaryota sp. GEM-RC1]